jgi:hypothetical protein
MKGHNGVQDDSEARRMSARTEPLQGGTIPSATHDATSTEIDSDIDDDRSVRNLVGLGTRESRFTTCRPTTP